MGSTQELQHWGIKGQKWGVRRFENPDGSLTEAGKKRYYYQNPDGSLTEAGKKDYMKAARKGKLDASKLSDNDLNMINSRFAREKTFNQNVSDYEKSTLKYRLKEAAIARIKGSGGGGGKGKGKGGGSGIAKILAIPIKKAFTDAFAEQKSGDKDSGKDDGYDKDNKWWKDVSNKGHRFTEKYFDPEKRPGIERTKKDVERGKKHMNFVVNENSGGRMGTFDATSGGNSYVEGRVRAAQQKKAEEKARRAAQRDPENRRQKNESENRRKEMDTEERLKKLGLAYASHSAIVIRRNSSDELYHWGIKGQKWGVRRFQNEDMTWTEAGKIRYGSGSDSDKHKFRKQFYMTSDEKAKKADQLVNLNKSGKAASSVVSREDTRKGDTREAKAQAVQAAVSSLLTLNPIPMAQLAVGGIKAANAQHKVNSYMKRREKNGQIDEKTGLYLKQADASYSDKQDLEAVNPGFENFNSNTKNNCMLCTTTYDLRKRGYDVTAQTDSAGFNFGDLKRWYPKAKFEKSTRINPDGSVMDKKTYVNNTISKLTKQGEGARGNIMVVFSKNFGGHSMVYEVKGGKLTIKDGQTGKIYSNPSKILNRTEGCSYARLDNVEPDIGLIKKECVR